MSSVGQALGGIVGGVIGSFVGGPSGAIYGAQLGLMAGAAIDPPKGPDITGPRLNDLRVQTSAYGAVIPRIYGTVATYGNLFWVENNQLKEVEKKEDVGGKGGPSQTQTTYSYYATFAVGICQGPIEGVRRIWAGSKLIYDAGDPSVGAMTASSESIGGFFERFVGAVNTAAIGNNFSIYYGTDDQEPDARMQAALGVDSTPAYRGLAYIVFYDFPLEEYGNSLLGCQIKVEVASDNTFSAFQRIVYEDAIFPPLGTTYGASDLQGPFDPVLNNGAVSVFKRYDEDTVDSYTIDMEGNRLPTPFNTTGIGDKYHVGTVNGQQVFFDQSISLGGGYLEVGGTVFKTRDGTNTAAFCGACTQDNRLYILMSYSGVGALEIYEGEPLAMVLTAVQSIYVDHDGVRLPLVPGLRGTIVVEPGGRYLWAFQTYAPESSVTVYEIADDGSISVHASSTLGYTGAYGSMGCAIAENGIGWFVSNGGSLAIYNRNKVITSQPVTLGSIVSAECLNSGLLTAGDIDVTGLTQEVRGYRVASFGAIRAAIEPLQAAWPFDIVQDGYKIKFKMRGGSSVATIDYDELGAVAGSEAPKLRLAHSREMALQLPRKVVCTYLDPNREYDTGSGPGAERLSTNAVNVLNSELPIVLTADEAAQIEERLLYLYWLERNEFAFTLPPTRANLQAADVITVEGGSATYSLRLTAINELPDGRLECTARANDAAVYSPTAVGQEGLATGQVLSYPGGSVAALLDIPCVDSTAMNKPGFLCALDGYLDGWNGGVLFRSDDSGQTWPGSQGFNAPGCVFGTTTNSIGSGTSHVIDEANRLTVRLFSGSLSSVSLTAMYSGANHFAYGAHGRWEIIAARNVTDNGDGTFTLSGLMRGRFGTERNMASHAVGDTLALLDRSAVRFMGMGVDSINLPRLYRPVTKGQSIDSVGDIEFTYAGENLECLSPVEVRATKSSTNDWSISWTRRTRTPVEPFSGLNAPLAESSEAYEVEIYSDNTYTTLKRTLTGLASASATYTSAQQTADFGAVQKFLYVKVYQLSATVGRGNPATAVVGPTHLINLKSLIHFDDGGYEYLPYRKLALHCDGTNGSTTFTDVHGKTVTANGNAQISTAQYPSLTGKTSSAYFDGTGDYLSIPDSEDFNFGSGSFTMRARIYLTGYATNNAGQYVACVISQDLETSRAFAFNINGTASSYTELIFIGFSDNTTGYTIVTSSYTFSLNTWYEVEVARYGNLVYLFVNGTLLNAGGTSFSRTIQNSTTTVKIGAENFDAIYYYYFPGYISEVEIYKGVALHTASFTPSASPFPDSAFAIIDKTGNTVTVTGTAAAVADAAAFGGYSLQAYQSSGYVSLPVIDLTSDKWTIECFIKPDALPSSGNLSGIAHYGASTNGVGGFALTIYSTGEILCYFAAGAGAAINAEVTFSAGERGHIFLMRDGANFYIGAKGTVGASKAVSSTSFVGDKAFRIGYADVSNFNAQNIKIDEWRVSANEAKYPTSGAYTIPAIAFPDP